MRWKGIGYRQAVQPDSPSEVVGRRIAAGFIDLVVVFLLSAAVGVAFGDAHSTSSGVSIDLHGASAFVCLLVVLTYYAVQEIRSGQTLGKRLFRIRVVSHWGGDPSAIAIAVRTLFRAVDFLPFFYLLGLVTIVASRRRGQRLGDLAARTTVVEARE